MTQFEWSAARTQKSFLPQKSTKSTNRFCRILSFLCLFVATSIAAQQPTQSPQPTPQPAPPSGTQPAGPGAAGQNVGVAPGAAPAILPQEPPPIAPHFEAPQRPLPSAERVGVDVSQQTTLSLREAIRLALQNSNDIEAAELDVRSAEFTLQGARGVYDPILSSESYYERQVTPTASTLGGGENGSVVQKTATGALRFGGFTPFAGGSYQFDFSSTRLDTNNSFVSLNPQFPSAFTFTYTQPLLRGLRFDDNRRQIEIAKRNLSLTDAQFRQRSIQVITNVVQAYWDLAFALRNLQVQIDAVKQARAQAESNQRQVEQGVLAPIDIVAANTQVSTFEQNVYTAQEAVTRAENTLKTLMLPDRNAALWSRALVPITPVDIEPPRITLADAVASALESRPELAQLRANAEISRINTRFFRDQTKPQVDLVATYTSNGLAGTITSVQNPLASGFVPLIERVNELSTLAGLQPFPVNTGEATIPGNLIGGLNQSLNNLLAQTYPTTRIGIRVSIPIRNRTAEANLGNALVQTQRVESQRAQTEQTIEADVRNSLQAVRSGEARLNSAAAARSSAEQQYQSELRQFQNGTSTVFLVLQRQQELVAARGNELQAQTELNKSISNFLLATGGTFKAYNVTVRADTPMRTFEMASSTSSGSTQAKQ